MVKVYELNSCRTIRAAFWLENPHVSRRRIRNHAGDGRMYCADTRCEFVEWLDSVARDGRASVDLCNRVTLE